MYRIACPACGAEVPFRSAASVLAVCEYCRCTLLREADAVRDIGKMAEVLEDYTRLQLGTSGVYEGQAFTLVGRIQLRYSAGFWNEWYALFDDGSGGWLSDASGQYVFTREVGPVPAAPAWELVRPGMRFRRDGLVFSATDVRTAECTGGQGELPFRVGTGWQARVADFRCDDRFMTLDYSDLGAEAPAEAGPIVYAGSAVTLESLRCQLLREADAIDASAGKLAGSVAALSCPACGAEIDYRKGTAEHLVCGSCHAEVRLSGDQAGVLRRHDELAVVEPTLPLGSRGKIDGAEWDVIGFLRRREESEDDEWTEYLLFNTERGFLWLSESADGWEKTEVLNQQPGELGGSARTVGDKSFHKLYEYAAVVTYAAGAFNWRVAIGERALVTSYRRGEETLYSERTDEEETWSLADSIPAAVALSWFGRKAAPTAPRVRRPGETGKDRDETGNDATDDYRRYAHFMGMMLLILNVPALLMGLAHGQWLCLAIALVGWLAIWMPVWLDGVGNGEGGEMTRGQVMKFMLCVIVFLMFYILQEWS